MIAIKNMKNIPKRCVECGLKSGGYCYHKNPPYDLNEFNILKEKPDDCPLVEIVTCKDCKFYRHEDDDEWCTNHSVKDNKFWVREDWFCADGERRE